MQPGQQLPDAVLEVCGEHRLVGLQEDTDGVQFIDACHIGEIVVKVETVLVNAPGVADARGVHQSLATPLVVDHVGLGVLGGRSSHLEALPVCSSGRLVSNPEALSVVFKLGRNQADGLVRL